MDEVNEAEKAAHRKEREGELEGEHEAITANLVEIREAVDKLERRLTDANLDGAAKRSAITGPARPGEAPD